MTRPFVDRPVTDIDAAIALADMAAGRWGLGRPSLTRHGMNAIFTTADAVIRVGEPTADAAWAIELADSLLRQGLRVPKPARDDVVVSGPMSATCWERIRESGAPVDWRRVGAMVRRVHELDPSSVPAAYPRPTPASFPWWDFEALLADTRDDIDAAALDGLERAIDRRAGWDDFDVATVCHGDVHPGNVLMGSDGPVLIDWDLLCTAPAAWDHGPLMTWHERWGGAAGSYEAFAMGYGRSMRADPVAEGFAELRLVAATLMRVRAARSDPSAVTEVELRLTYWRGSPGAKQWTAQ